MSRRTFDDPTSDEARQALLDNRSEHKPKRHRTLGRRKRMSAAKRQHVKHRLAERDRARSKFLDKARAYWRGDADGHP